MILTISVFIIDVCHQVFYQKNTKSSNGLVFQGLGSVRILFIKNIVRVGIIYDNDFQYFLYSSNKS